MKTGIVSNFAEELALKSVLEPAIQESAHQCIHANYAVDLQSGKRRIIDFAIISAANRIAIEIDGFAYHAEGVISREKFDDQLDRQNELVLAGWTVVRFSFDQIRREPEKCQDQLRRLFVSDDQLHRNFSRRSIAPTSIQFEALKALESARKEGLTRGLVAIPTGTGKTILSALDAQRVGGRVLFIVHNNEILRQAAKAYLRIRPAASLGFINSEVEEHGHAEDMVFANISSLRRTISNFRPDHFAYVVIDEFHHGAADSYAPVISYLQPKFMLGLTATPERTDKKSILNLLNGNFIYSVSTAEAIARGFLVPFTYYGLHDNVDYSLIQHNGYRYDITDLEKSLLIPRRDRAIVEKYQEISKNLKAIGFCISIKHAERMAEVFSSAGIKSVAVHSQLAREDRDSRIEAYERGEVTCIFVRDLFNEGVDFPSTQALLFLRPTESKIIFQQQLGRGLRLSPGKQNVQVLDFIGNYYGAFQVSEAILGIGSGGTDEYQRPKPEHIYENGCKIYFSEKVIEHLTLPDQKVFRVSDLVGKIFGIYEREQRSLTPLDLFIALGNELGHAIRQLGSYKILIERMNTIDACEVVLDPSYENFDPTDGVQGGESQAVVDAKAAVIYLKFELLLEIIAKGNVPRLPKFMQRRCAEDLHFISLELLELVAEICLLKNSVDVYAREIGTLINPPEVLLSDAKSDIFQYLASSSSRRNSFAISNYLRGAHARIAAIFVSCMEYGEGKNILFLQEILKQKTLQWLVDLSDLTSEESIS